MLLVSPGVNHIERVEGEEVQLDGGGVWLTSVRHVARFATVIETFVCPKQIVADQFHRPRIDLLEMFVTLTVNTSVFCYAAMTCRKKKRLT